MNSKNKILAIILSLLTALLISTPLLAAGQNELSADVGEFLPVWACEQHELTVLSVAPLVIGDHTVGLITVYDDPATERPADYFELYDSSGGNLLAVSWFDRFGIERTAIDRGVLEGADKLEGIFVVIIDGESV
jgi:hypothetical protein